MIKIHEQKVIELLRKIRNDAGISLRKLSKMSGISKTYLIDMEIHPNKCNPTFEMIFNLEQSLKVKPGTVYLYFVDIINNLEIDESINSNELMKDQDI
jgi:transcriptional regulator with XRE-family HTH domain